MYDGMKEKKIIRETTSICPQCGKKIAACIIETEGGVYLSRECPTHGLFDSRISQHAWYYSQLTEYYFDVMPDSMEQRRFYIYLSNSCNLQCPICLLEPNQKDIPRISLEEFKTIFKSEKKSRFYLYGAEPTLCDDIEEWIKSLKKTGNMVNMHTNGIKLADLSFLTRLKKAGLDYVSLQFDGFDDNIYKQLRGKELLKEKKKALENLKKLHIPTGLNVTIAKDVNEPQIKYIIDYAIKNDFIRDVSFATLSYLGDAKKNFIYRDLLMSDELIDLVEEQTDGYISRKNMYIFQKLYFAVLSAFNIRRCYNFHHIALIREKNAYKTMDVVFNMKSIEHKLDEYKNLYKKNKIIARTYFMIQIVLHILIGNVFQKCSCLPFNILLPGRIRSPRIPSKVLLVSFGTVCDAFKYDHDIAKYCGQGFVIKKEGLITLSDSISEVTLMNQESR